MIRAKEAVEAENAEIKGRLASIMALIQPILSGHQGGGETYAPPAHSSVPVYPTPQAPPPSLSLAKNTSPAPSTASPVSVDTPPYCPTRIPSATAQPQLNPRLGEAKVPGQQRQDLHNLDPGIGEQLRLHFLVDPSQRASRLQTGAEGVQDSPTSGQLPTKHEWSGPATSDQLQRHQQHPHTDPELAPSTRDEIWANYSTPIKNTPSTCPLDSILLAFLHERRQRAAAGEPMQIVLGPSYPSVSSLLNPATNAYVHPMTKVFTDILAAFPGVFRLPERVAILYYMFLNMRLSIDPSRETYNRLPWWARPTASQLSTPHPAWVDHVPFPRMREKLAREHNSSEYLFDNFFIPFTSTISVNWPYEPEDAFYQMPNGGELLINPVFERHLRRIENWTLGENFDKVYPQLRGTYYTKTDSPRSTSGP